MHEEHKYHKCNIFANFNHKTEFEKYMKSTKIEKLETFSTRFALYYRIQLEYQKLKKKIEKKTTTFIFPNIQVFRNV